MKRRKSSGVAGGGNPAIACRESAGGSDPCAPGQTLFDQTFPTVAIISTDSIGTPPTYGVYEIPLIDFGPCTNFRIAVTLDMQATDGGGDVHAFLAASGLPLNTRDFSAFGTYNARLAYHTYLGAGYHTYQFYVWPSLATPYEDFAGPLPTQSLYIWPPALPPDFEEGTWDVKNVHVVITTT